MLISKLLGIILVFLDEFINEQLLLECSEYAFAISSKPSIPANRFSIFWPVCSFRNACILSPEMAHHKYAIWDVIMLSLGIQVRNY